MQKYFLAIIFILALGGCNSDKQPAAAKSEATMEQRTAETARINEWFEQQYEKELSYSPISLTIQGRKERYAEIDDFSDAAADAQLEWKHQSVAQMKAQFNYELLDDEAKTSWDLWDNQYQNDLRGKSFRRQEYVFHQMGGIHTFLPTFMINFHRVETHQDMQDYISRLNAAATGLQQLIDQAEAGVEAGVRAPRFAYDIVSEQVNKIISGRPFTDDEHDSALWEDVQNKVEQLLKQEQITEQQAIELRSSASDSLRNELKAAYQMLLVFLEEDYINTQENAVGASALPNGEDYYNFRLSLMTTTSMTADEIHTLGLSEVKRLREEMEAVKELAGFSGSLQEFFVFQREAKPDPRLYFQEPQDCDAETEKCRSAADNYIAEATAAIDNIKAQLPKYFGVLPKADLEVKRVEAFREQDGAAQHYFPGTPDGSRAGTYYAHLSDMSAMPRAQLEVIAYHEGLPGHHMQISIAQELTDIPTFRTQADATAYTEGWALYSELFAKEISNTYVDPYSEFGRLASEMFRAIRLVVDTGLHTKDWSQQRAVEYFSNNSPEPLTSIESEVMRYLVIPGQATSYKIGMLDILRLREQAEADLGERFDIRSFHDVILSGGALPLRLLDQRVQRWLSAQREPKE